jgi:hypothetical protein
MLIPKKNRKEVYKYLFKGAPIATATAPINPTFESYRVLPISAFHYFQTWQPPFLDVGLVTSQARFISPDNSSCASAEGVLYAEKDFNLAAHPEIPGVPNLQVIKLMQSFKSKELVTERFAWRHYYWCDSSASVFPGILPAGMAMTITALLGALLPPLSKLLMSREAEEWASEPLPHVILQ